MIRAKIPAAAPHTTGKPTPSTAIPTRGPTRAPICPSTLKTAKTATRSSSASCARYAWTAGLKRAAPKPLRTAAASIPGNESTRPKSAKPATRITQPTMITGR